MPCQTNEQALESAIKKRLTSICLEELKAYKSNLINSAVTGKIKIG